MSESRALLNDKFFIKELTFTLRRSNKVLKNVLFIYLFSLFFLKNITTNTNNITTSSTPTTSPQQQQQQQQQSSNNADTQEKNHQQLEKSHKEGSIFFTYVSLNESNRKRFYERRFKSNHQTDIKQIFGSADIQVVAVYLLLNFIILTIFTVRSRTKVFRFVLLNPSMSFYKTNFFVLKTMFPLRAWNAYVSF